MIEIGDFVDDKETIMTSDDDVTVSSLWDGCVPNLIVMIDVCEDTSLTSQSQLNNSIWL